jgi:hypothetical protein
MVLFTQVKGQQFFSGLCFYNRMKSGLVSPDNIAERGFHATER